MTCRKDDAINWLLANLDKWSNRPTAPEEERAWLLSLAQQLANEGVLCGCGECGGSMNDLLSEARKRIVVRLESESGSIQIGGEPPEGQNLKTFIVG